MKKGILYKVITGRKVTLFVTAMVFIGGLFSYMTAVKQESPEFEVPMAVISYTYIGASASEIEALVSTPIQNEMDQIEGCVSVNTYSKNNGGLVWVEFDYDVDRNQTFDEVRRRLADLEKDLPNGATISDITAGVIPVTDFMYVLTTTKTDQDNYMNSLELEAKELADEISNMDSVKSASIQGEEVTSIEVIIDNQILGMLPATRVTIGQLIESLDTRIPGGNILGEESISVQSISGLTGIDDIKQILLGQNPISGQPITLSDIADVQYVSSDTIKTTYDNQPGILVYGYFVEGLDQTSIADDFSADIQSLSENLPEGMVLQELIYYPDDVKTSNNSFFINLLVGILLVILISFISMGIRNAIVVSFALPTSVFLTLIMMKALGIELHQVSIASLIIAIGMLVDNAIVITESIKSKIESGIDRLEATISGTKDVAIPVLTSTLTTIAAFSPLMFIPSIVGDYIISVPQVIIIALSSSYVVSITLMPCLSYMLFNHLDRNAKKSRPFRFIETIIGWLLRRKALVLTSVLIITVVAVLTIPKIGLSFFPKADKDICYINITNKDGIDVDDTNQKVEDIQMYLANEPHVVHYLTTIGGGVPRFWDTMRTYSKSPDFAQILIQVDLKDDYENNTELVEKIQEDLNQIDDTLKIEVKELEKGEPIEAPITIEVTSKNLDDITIAKDYTRDILEGIEGVTFIRDNEALAIDSYEIHYDNNALSQKGLVLPLVQAEVSYAINGKEVASIKSEDGFTAIIVKGQVSKEDELLNLIIGHNQEGTGVTLREVATIQTVQTRSSINKYRGDYAVTVLANVKSGYSSVEIMKTFEDQLDKNRYPSITWLYEGEGTSIANNFGDLGIMAVFAAFLILIILVIQFNSFRQTAIILMSIPLAGAGALFGLYFTGYPLSFTALLGIVSLMGIVVNNAILLMDSIDKRRDEGLNIKYSAIEGSKKRIRPILLTTITTISGLIPLMLSGSEMFAPMAIAIGSGLLFSTVITLLVIPILYRILFGKSEPLV